jgi:hypothetical protein
MIEGVDLCCKRLEVLVSGLEVDGLDGNAVEGARWLVVRSAGAGGEEGEAAYEASYEDGLRDEVFHGVIMIIHFILLWRDFFMSVRRRGSAGWNDICI